MLPGDLTSVVVTGRYLDPSGQALAGRITFTPTTTLADATGSTVIPAYGKTYDLAAGSFTTDALAATDNADILPAGWLYTVTLALQNLPPASFTVAVPRAPLSFTATSAAPCVLTAAGSAYANGAAVSLAGGSLPAGFTAATAYYVVAASGASFSLAATRGGSAITSTSTGSGTVGNASLDISALTPTVPQSQLLAYLALVGGTMTGTLVLDGSPALQIPGGAAGEILTSDGAGNAAWSPAALQVKPPVQEATAAALPSNTYASGALTATANGALTVDGVAVSAGDRVLVKNEAAPANNGIYTVTAAGAGGAKYVLTRTPDMAVAGEVPGALTFAEQGTVNVGSGFIVAGKGPYTIGTTAITWTQAFGPGSITAFDQSRLGWYYPDSYAGTADQKFAAALAAVQAAGGGTVKLSAGTVTYASQIATALGGSPYYLRILGCGAGSSTGDANAVGVTTVNLTYAGGGAAKMDFHHAGTIEIAHIAFTDTAATTVPFFQCTNPSPKLHDLGFTGSGTALGGGWVQDGIYVGGWNASHALSDNDDAAFQGYQGVVERITFSGLRTCVWVRAYGNSVILRELEVNGSCGAANVFSVSDAAISLSTPTTLTSATAGFTSGMVGQAVFVAGAGLAAQQQGWLSAVISAFTSSTQVTISVAAQRAVTAARCVAPGGFCVAIGGPLATGGVGSVVLADSIIECNGYPVAVGIYNSDNNCLYGTSFWDGISTNITSVWMGGFSGISFVQIPNNDQGSGIPPVMEDVPGANTILSPSQQCPVQQFCFAAPVSAPGGLSVPGAGVTYTDGVSPGVPDGTGGTYGTVGAGGALESFHKVSGVATPYQVVTPGSPTTIWDFYNAAQVVLRNFYGSIGLEAIAGSKVFIGDTSAATQVYGHNGGFVVGGGAALATTATTGFMYLPTCAGPPTGVPATETGTAAAVVDTTDSKIYVNVGGTWKSATLS